MTDGARYLYDLLPALGVKTDSKPLPSHAQTASQPPTSLAQNPVDNEAPVGKLVEGVVQVRQVAHAKQEHPEKYARALGTSSQVHLQEAHETQEPTATLLSDTEDFLPFNLGPAPAAASSAAAERDQQRTASTSASDDLPWASGLEFSSPMLRLHHGESQCRGLCCAH